MKGIVKPCLLLAVVSGLTITLNGCGRNGKISFTSNSTISIAYPDEKQPTARIDENGNGAPEYIMEINPWNIKSADGKAVMSYNPLEKSFTYSQHLEDAEPKDVEGNSSGYVLGYPEVYYGNKPWNTY